MPDPLIPAPPAPPPAPPAVPPATPPAVPPTPEAPVVPAVPPAPPATPPAAPPATPPPAKVENLMDEATPPATPPPATPPTDITEEAIGAFVGAIPAELGFDAVALKAVAPAMLKNGINATQAQEIIGAYATHAKAQQEAAAQQEATFIGELVTQTKTELGKDLPLYVADAKKGGAAIFGKDLWDQFKSIPSFVNDVRVIKALAAHGRSIKTDDGAGGGGGGNNPEAPLIDRWIKNSMPK